MRKTILWLAGIFLLGVILRFYQLGAVPVGLHRDEAFLGYNAYSLMKTGRDMTGRLLPLHLESFLYSPAGYSYASIPFILLFGLSAFSVRFASALFGSLTILITFFLVRNLVNDKKISALVSLLAALFLAISPWHINLSRTATENPIVVFFMSLGLFLFLRWMKDERFMVLFFSFCSFGITYAIYQAPRAFLPIFLPVLFFVYRKTVKQHLFPLLFLYVFVILLPVLLILKSPNLSLRIRTVSIFADQHTQLTLDESIREDGHRSVLTRIFHNKLTSYAGVIVSNYFDHFSYRFLFTDDVLPIRYKIPGSGLLYLFDLPLLLVGAWMLLKKHPKEALVLVGWIALAPVGDALTFDDIPNLQRTLLVFPVVSVVSAYGFFSFLSFLPKYKKVFLYVGAVVVAWNLVSYLHQYYVHGMVHQPWYRQEGYKELVATVDSFLSKYTQAVITDRESAPTIFFLFYNKVDPSSFQQVAKTSVLRDFDRVGFKKFVFSQEECPLRDITLPSGVVATTGQPGILYIDSGNCRQMMFGRLISEIHRSDNSTVFRIYDIQ